MVAQVVPSATECAVLLRPVHFLSVPLFSPSQLFWELLLSVLFFHLLSNAAEGLSLFL